MHNQKGEEIIDPTSQVAPVKFKRPPSIQDQIKRLVHDSDMRRSLQDRHIETFEEADDFDVEDDLPMESPYEENFDKLHTITRKHEIENGFVSDIPEPKKQKAREIWRKAQEYFNRKPEALGAEAPTAGGK